MHCLAIREDAGEFLIGHARPSAHRAHIQMHKRRAGRWIITNTATLQTHGDFAHFRHGHVGIMHIHRAAENVLRMFSYATRAAAQHGIGFWRTIGGENVNGRTRTGFAIGFPNHVKKFRVHFRRRIGAPVTQEPIQFFKHGTIILPIDTEGRGNALTCVNMIEIDRARIAISDGILCSRSRKSSRKGETEGANRQKIAEASGGGFERHQAHSSTRGPHRPDKVNRVLPKRVNRRSTAGHGRAEKTLTEGLFLRPRGREPRGLFANSRKCLRAIAICRAHRRRPRNSRCGFVADAAFSPCARHHL